MQPFSNLTWWDFLVTMSFVLFFSLQALLLPQAWQPQWPSLICWRPVMELFAWMTCMEVSNLTNCTKNDAAFLTWKKVLFIWKWKNIILTFILSISRHKPLLPKNCCYSWSRGDSYWLYKTREAEGRSEGQHKSKSWNDIVRKQFFVIWSFL